MKSQIIKGTFILSAAGILTRIVGFYYRIFLSRTIGATGMGLYQMIFPAFGLCHSISIIGIQMSISRFTAIKNSRNDREGMYTVLKIGMFFSLLLSSVCCLALYYFSDIIAIYVFDEPRCGVLLRVICFSVPLCAFHGCICGYYLGKQNASVSALSQLIEPVVRVGGIYVIATVMTSNGHEITPVLACVGMILGEAASSLLSLCFLCGEKKFFFSRLSNPAATFKEMYGMAYPLTLNKVAAGLLTAFESVMIPISLKKSGLSPDSAISMYGVLTGMAMPFIMFPSTITGSVSAMVMPSVAQSQSKGDYSHISKTTSTIIKYCLSIGIFCTGFFYVYGERIGKIFFDNDDAGLYISILSWLCPFMYITVTMGSILNGMGKTKTTFLHNIISTVLRLLFILFAIPAMGIKGCLFGILSSQILCTILHTYVVYRTLHFKYNTFEYIIKPLFITGLSIGISLSVLHLLSSMNISDMAVSIISMLSGGIIFAGYLAVTAKKDI